jgi:hypothetical protein
VKQTIQKQVAKLLIFSGILFPTILFGCAAARLPFVPFPTGITPPRTVAVMPLDNQTNSVPGAIYLREVMYENLRQKWYVALPISEVDQRLSDQLGISLGGQITEDRIPEIGKTLGVDAVIMGTVQKFGTVLALYNEVEATFSLYEAHTGKKLWNYHGYARLNTELTGRQGEYTSPVLAELIFRGLGKPLAPVVGEFYKGLFARMPNGAEPPQK